MSARAESMKTFLEFLEETMVEKGVLARVQPPTAMRTLVVGSCFLAFTTF